MKSQKRKTRKTAGSKNKGLLLTPKEWCEREGVRILDPDGWRADGKDFNEPIQFGEWEARMVLSSCMFLPLPKGKTGRFSLNRFIRPLAETPLTDDVEKAEEASGGRHGFVPADFARGLERRARQLSAELERKKVAHEGTKRRWKREKAIADDYRERVDDMAMTGGRIGKPFFRQ